MSALPLYDASLKAWVADYVGRIFAPLKADVGMEPNPLAYGHRCPDCGTFLDRSDRPCPMGCKR